MSDSTADRIERAVAGAATAAAAIIAYFAGPLLPFVEPTMLAQAGLVLAFGIAGLWLGAASPAARHWDFLLGCGMAAVGLLGVVFVGYVATTEQRANDRRCLDIQHRMFVAKPDRSDLPDLFQALGCRPQGEGSVYAPTVKPAAVSVPSARFL